MAHHLAALVSAAQDEATVEQRLEIVDTILRIWTVHQHLPSPPLAEFAAVIAGLERLGTTNPWAFWRLGVPDSLHADGNGKSLVSAALELEKLTRETLLRLIWLAARDATERNQDWLRLADQIGPTIGTEVASALRMLQLDIDLEATTQDESADLEVAADPEKSDEVSNLRHATRLRSMATLLTGLADSLDSRTG
jgi:hypothetical protein